MPPLDSMSPLARTAAALLILTGMAPWAGAQTPGSGAGLEVEPSRVHVGLFYHGTTLQVGAQIPAGSEAAVRLTGRADRLELKEKGKVGGVLWMSVGDVVFEDVPALYLLLTTAPLDQLAPAAVLDQWKLGYHSLVPADSAGVPFVPELIKLKERDALWSVQEGGLAAGAQATTLSLTGRLHLPAAVPPGEYALDLIVFQDQQASRLATTTVVVERVGSVHVIRELAMQHGLFYGCAAAAIAIVAGLLTGLLFQSKRREAH